MGVHAAKPCLHPTGVALAVAASLMLLGCQAGTEEGAASGLLPPAAAPAGSELPPFPADGATSPGSPASRSGNVARQRVLHGNEFFLKSETAEPDDGWQIMDLKPETGSTAWAVYQFAGFASSDTLLGLTIDFPLPPALLYIGLPDCERRVWSIRQVNAPPQSSEIFLPPTLDLVNDDGAFYVALIAWSNNRTVIGKLTIDVDIVGPAPANVQASDGSFTDKVRVTWESVEGATGYKIYRDGQEPSDLLGSVGEITMYDDADVENLRQYTYWVRGVFESAHGRMSDPDAGFRSNWQSHTVDEDGSVGMYTSAAVIDGRPAIAYYDYTQGSLKYSLALIAAPESEDDWATHVVDDQGKSGEMASLSIIDGRPAIAYFDDDQGNLRFARALTAMPTQSSDWQAHIVDEVGWVGEYCSLAAIGTTPVISYFDYSNTNLKFALALDPAPSTSTDWQVHTVDDGMYVGRFTSCLEYGGRPAISYFDEIPADLKLACATTSAPAAAGDWSIQIVDSGGVVGTYTSLAIIDHRLAISYHDWTNRHLKFARALTTAPQSSADWVIMAVDKAGTVGLHTSLSDLDGHPIISYYDYDGSDLKVAWATDTSPKASTDWYIRFVDKEGAVGSYTSLIVYGDRPAVSYFDASNSAVKFAWPPD